MWCAADTHTDVRFGRDSEKKGTDPETECKDTKAPNSTWCMHRHAFPLSARCGCQASAVRFEVVV